MVSFTRTGVLVLASVAGAALALAQRESLEEWEKRTFVNQPPEAVMDAAGIRPGMVVGEVGAGRGRFTMPLASRVGPAGKVLANDVDAEALAFLRERCRKEGVGNVETILGEGGDPKLPAGALDVAFMVWVYHYVEPPVAAEILDHLRSAVKPGGTVVLVEPNPAHHSGGEGHPVTPSRMEKDARAAGFDLVRTETFLPEDLIYILRPTAVRPQVR